MVNEQTNTESAPNEGTGLPNPASSESGQPSSAVATGEVSNQELAKRLEKLERQEQSAKDRAIDQLRKDFEKQLADISGKPVAKAEEPATIAKPDTGTISAAQAIPEALARFTEVGLSVSDPEVASLIGKSTEFKTRQDFLLEAERVINRKFIKPSVSAAAVVAPPASAPPPANVSELTGEYIKKVTALRGQKEAIRQLQNEYKQKGVPVEKITFTVK